MLVLLESSMQDVYGQTHLSRYPWDLSMPLMLPAACSHRLGRQLNNVCSGQPLHAAQEYTDAAGSSTAVVSLDMIALLHDHTRRSAATCPACVDEH
jgi:hypothetical protein